MKQCQTLKHGRTSVPSVPSGDTFNGCSGSRWIYMDLPWFTDWIPHPKEVQDSPKRPWETHDQLCVIPVLCPTCSVQHSKPTGSLNIMSWQISWNSHITILVYYTITNIYIYIIYILYISHDWSKSPEAVPSVPLYSYAWHEIFGDLSQRWNIVSLWAQKLGQPRPESRDHKDVISAVYEFNLYINSTQFMYLSISFNF